MHILVTGGAGFIGTHLVNALLQKGHVLRVFDALTPQIHGPEAIFKPDLQTRVDCIKGDVIDREALSLALNDVDVVVHLAAETGMGQSQYEIDRYFRVNVLGTAVLLDVLANSRHHVKRIIVASSARVYGEGPYICPDHGRIFPPPRTSQQMFDNDWEMRCTQCGQIVTPALCLENDLLRPGSMYAITKESQERMLHLFGQIYGVETLVLRYQNVYGGGQALRNPYTGVLVTFCNQVRNNLAPEIFEDGLETRDFVHVKDIIAATASAIEIPGLSNETINIGSGIKTTILEIADRVIQAFESPLKPQINGKFRLGEVRHMQADISKAYKLLEYQPCMSLDAGIGELVNWVRQQPDQADQSHQAISELRKHNLYLKRT